VQYGRTVIYLGGDIITSVNGMKTNTLADLYASLEACKPGDKIKIEIVRDSQPLTLEIVLADREEVMN
jgi:S1-C subfamily serine protease